jgi:hypothetical protein
MDDTSWTVTGTREEYDWVDGQYRKGLTVFYRTGKGQTGSVFVVDTDMSTDRVRSAIAPKAAAQDAVLDLTGG